MYLKLPVSTMAKPPSDGPSSTGQACFNNLAQPSDEETKPRRGRPGYRSRDRGLERRGFESGDRSGMRKAVVLDGAIGVETHLKSVRTDP